LEKKSTSLEAQLLRLCHMALTDGEFSPLDWKMLYEFAMERNISKEELDQILLSIIGYLEVPDSIDEKLEYLYDFARMIWADNEVTEDDGIILKKICFMLRYRQLLVASNS
jgi:hypothetical protein